MGYLPQFKNDLFISYTHASNEGRDKWVDTFRNGLEVELKNRIGGDALIWIDSEKI